MERRPLLGDEALALGAIHAGISGAFAYPGTPSTEIFEFVEKETHGGPPAREGGVHHRWSANEKVAYEEALGVSFAGRRAMVSFKHVGLNVAADPFMNSAVTGAHGGFVVVSADDPGMHSSQNAQDSRVFADFALLPVLEPADGQECYEMAREAFDLSERFRIPFLIRLVTRIAHSRSGVTVGTPRAPNPLDPTTDYSRWTLIPGNARRNYTELLKKQPELVAWSESESRYNRLHLTDSKRGVITTGIARNYLLETMGASKSPHSHLHIGAYPIPEKLVAQLVDHCDEVLVLEDGYPYVEKALRGLLDHPRGKTIHGRLDGRVPRSGELTPDNVREALGEKPLERQPLPELPLPSRPPSLCPGCPHIDSFQALTEALALESDTHPHARIFGDIGCYALGFLPPYGAIQTCVDMGASISMAAGAAAVGIHPAIAVLGDSTFIHSGMTGLVGAAKANLPMTVFILDNATIGMTGGQETLATGHPLEAICLGLGVDPAHLQVVTAHRKNHDENLALFRREIAHPGLSVIITVRECIQTAKKRG